MVRNIHERTVGGSPDEVWEVLRDFGSLYPASSGTFTLPNGLYPGAPVLHDKAKYRVGAVEPGRRIWFDVGRIMPNGHGIELFPADRGTLVRHTLDGPVRGLFALLWPIVIRRAHNRAIEGLLDNLERAMAQRTRRPAGPSC